MKRKRTLRQKWVFERLFNHAGSIASMMTTLRRIQDASSTLYHEKQALARIEDILKVLKMNRKKEDSWTQFKRLEGEENGKETST